MLRKNGIYHATRWSQIILSRKRIWLGKIVKTDHSALVLYMSWSRVVQRR